MNPHERYFALVQKTGTPLIVADGKNKEIVLLPIENYEKLLDQNSVGDFSVRENYDDFPFALDFDHDDDFDFCDFDAEDAYFDDDFYLDEDAEPCFCDDGECLFEEDNNIIPFVDNAVPFPTDPIIPANEYEEPPVLLFEDDDESLFVEDNFENKEVLEEELDEDEMDEEEKSGSIDIAPDKEKKDLFEEGAGDEKAEEVAIQEELENRNEKSDEDKTFKNVSLPSKKQNWNSIGDVFGSKRFQPGKSLREKKMPEEDNPYKKKYPSYQNRYKKRKSIDNEIVYEPQMQTPAEGIPYKKHDEEILPRDKKSLEDEMAPIFYEEAV